MTRIFKVTCVSAMALAAAMTAGPAMAQDNAGAAPQGFEDIVVTARKVEETQQSLAITIAAFSQEDLQKKVVLNVADLQKVTPGLSVSVNTQGGSPIFAIRGTATANLIDGGVALYFDDMPLMSSIALVNAFYDVATVEILKGPQGTQFGTNTTGGTITVRAKKPTDQFEGYVTAGYGNYNRRELEAMINIPINDVLSFRAAGNMVKRDGFVRNAAATGNIPKRLWDDDHWSFRTSLRMEKGSVTNDIVFDYYNEDDVPIPSVSVLYTDASIPGTNPANFGARLGSRKRVFAGPNPSGSNRIYSNRQKLWGIQDVLHIDVTDNFSIRNVFGFRRDQAKASESNTYNGLALIDVLTEDNNRETVDDLTLNFRSGDGRLRGSLGAYYSQTAKDKGVVANAAQNIFLVLTGLPLVSNIHNYERNRKESKALYTNVDFDATDTLTVSGGFRYNWDKADLRYSAANGVGIPDLGDNYFPTAAVPCNVAVINGFVDREIANCIGRRNGSWKAASYNLVVTNKFTDRVLGYAKLSHGYLAGGLNSSIREVPAFNPEKTTMYEAGLKADWFLAGRPFRSNIAIYYGKIDNKQLVANTNYDDGASGNGVFNAAKESVYGTDIELRYSPFQSLTLDAGWSYLHAKWDEFQFPTIGGPVRTLTPGIDLSGQTPAQVPKNQISLGATYTLPLDPGLGTISASWGSYFTSAIRFRNTDNTQGRGRQFDTADKYWVSSASINWDAIGGSSLSARFWMKNVFDKVYTTYNDAQFNAFGYAIVRFGEPRTFGASATYKF